MGATATVEAPAAGARKKERAASKGRGASARTASARTAPEEGSCADGRGPAPKPAGKTRTADSAGKRNKALGRKGEDAAARYLEQRGYDIVARNWKCVAGEADIVARDEDWLVFVEVKTRRNTDKGFPSEAVDERKRSRYERIALAWAASHSDTDVPVRFDVVSIVVVGKDKAVIRHHMNAFTR